MKNNYSEIKLGEFTYVVGVYPTTKGINILVRLSKLLGIPLLQGAGAVEGGAQDLMKSGIKEVLPKIAEALQDRLDEDVVIKLIRDILATTQVTEGSDAGSELSKDSEFDRHFKGDYTRLFKLVWEVLGYQYSDLKNALGDVIGRGLKEFQASKKVSPDLKAMN